MRLTEIHDKNEKVPFIVRHLLDPNGPEYWLWDEMFEREPMEILDMAYNGSELGVQVRRPDGDKQEIIFTDAQLEDNMTIVKKDGKMCLHYILDEPVFWHDQDDL